MPYALAAKKISQPLLLLKTQNCLWRSTDCEQVPGGDSAPSQPHRSLGTSISADIRTSASLRPSTPRRERSTRLDTTRLGRRLSSSGRCKVAQPFISEVQLPCLPTVIFAYTRIFKFLADAYIRTQNASLRQPLGKPALEERMPSNVLVLNIEKLWSRKSMSQTTFGGPIVPLSEFD